MEGAGSGGACESLGRGVGGVGVGWRCGNVGGMGGLGVVAVV